MIREALLLSRNEGYDSKFEYVAALRKKKGKEG